MFLSTLLEKTKQKAQQVGIDCKTLFSKITLAQDSLADIQDIQYDSRRVSHGDLFCVLSGAHTHGKHFVDSVIKQGAAAVLVEEPEYAEISKNLDNNTGVIVVPNTTIKRAMSLLSKVFFLNDLAIPIIVGITGTDGKTTTVHFLQQLAQKVGMKAGYWSTIEYHDGSNIHENTYRQSTPEAPDIFRSIGKMAKQGCALAILEATSHGLSHRTMRMIDVSFDFAGLTNIGTEHLDFHETVEQYAEDKSNIFGQIFSLKEQDTDSLAQQLPQAFIRFEEPYRELCTKKSDSAQARLASYSLINQNAEYYFDIHKESLEYTKGTLHHPTKSAAKCVSSSSPMQLNCFGRFNAENALLAVALMHSIMCTQLQKRGQSLLYDIANAVSVLYPPLGHLQTIEHSAKFKAIVDYAHTPQSFSVLLPIVAQLSQGRLIVVFGSAGERDIQKRAKQGAVADAYADIIVLSDEDPRGEDSKHIIEHIASACTQHQKEKNLFFIPNREKAIAFAISLAEEDDTILFLGKGHEKSIEYAHETIKWDEIEVIRKYLS